MNPFLATDGYKVDHHRQYPEGTTLVYSNFTPRAAKHAPKGVNKDYIISFGQQMVMRQIKEMFDEDFFCTREIGEQTGYNIQANLDKYETRWSQKDEDEARKYAKLEVRERVCTEIKQEYSTYLGVDYDVSHIEALWDLGYLPIKVKALPEGTKVPIGVPVLTIVNTKPEFFWLTNFLETLISNLLWKPMTSATIAYNYRQNLMSWAEKTDKENVGFVDFQGHDFSMRGMDSVDATISSGLGHATSFLGSDSLPVIHGARKYYDEESMVIAGVPATEHSVMCAGSKDDEISTFRRLMSLYPTGILSVVSDTWDLWKVLTKYLPELKEEVLARDGKLVIRPDSGDPVDIICGYNIKKYNTLESAKESFKDLLYDNQEHGESYYNIPETLNIKVGNQQYLLEAKTYWNRYDKQYYHIEYINIIEMEVATNPEDKGVIELLWDVFGGTINEQGYKVLDSHIGAIYGDSITLDRAQEICKRLESKGFASSNIVLGIGSFTYQFNTRDTFGFAMKATYVEISRKRELEEDKYLKTPIIEGREIFKDPITDDGTKKSAKGLLNVGGKSGKYILNDQSNWDQENVGCLQTIFEDGEYYNETTLTEIRNKLK